VQITSVFIKRDVTISSLAFIEDFLSCIHRQLIGPAPGSDEQFEQYEEACQNGEAMSRRLTLLRSAICSRLDGYDHTFLVFDGYDRLNEELQVLLDGELLSLQEHCLRVLQTRRVPEYKLPLSMMCDGVDCEDGARLNLYWVCISSACKLHCKYI
jgi:hypothetical protein